MTLEKFVSADAWGSEVENISAADEAKAERGRFIDQGTYDVTVVQAQHKFKECAGNDPAFHKFVVSVRNDAGDSRDIMIYFSPKKFGYGEKRALVFGHKMKALFRALGMPEYSLSDKSGANWAILRKFLGGYDENGILPNWAGLRFNASFLYKEGTFHVAKIDGGAEGYALVDHKNNVAVFPSVKSFEVETNSYTARENASIRGGTVDAVKAHAALNGIKPQMSELMRMAPIDGANDALLRRWDAPAPVVPVKATQPTDAQSLVEGTEDEAFPF